jgi:hypothetical protein
MRDPEGARKRAITLSHAFERQESETAGKARAHAERKRAAVLPIIRPVPSSLPQAPRRPSWDQFHRLARSPVDPHLCHQRSARLPE